MRRGFLCSLAPGRKKKGTGGAVEQPEPINLDRLRRLALGPLGLNHDQFYGLTVREFSELLEGYQFRDETRFRYYGWHAASIMQLWAKKGSKISVDKLCGRAHHTRDPEKAPEGKAFLRGPEHEQIRDYFRSAKRRKSKGSARA